MKRSTQRGFTLIELIIALIILSVLATASEQRLAVYQELAEKATMDATLSIIKTGLQIRLAQLIIDNRQREAVSLEKTNPMAWLSEKPANYLGAYRRPPEGRSWYYDERRDELVYVAQAADHLRIPMTDGTKQIRFRTRLLRDKVHAGGTVIDSVSGVTLVPVFPYSWTLKFPDKLWT